MKQKKLTGEAYASASKEEKRAELARRAQVRLGMGRGGVATTARLKAARAALKPSTLNVPGGKSTTPLNTEPKSKGVAGNLTSRPSLVQTEFRKRKRQRSGRGRRTRGGYLEG